MVHEFYKGMREGKCDNHEMLTFIVGEVSEAPYECFWMATGRKKEVSRGRRGRYRK